MQQAAAAVAAAGSCSTDQTGLRNAFPSPTPAAWHRGALCRRKGRAGLCEVAALALCCCSGRLSFVRSNVCCCIVVLRL